MTAEQEPSKLSGLIRKIPDATFYVGEAASIPERPAGEFRLLPLMRLDEGCAPFGEPEGLEERVALLKREAAERGNQYYDGGVTTDRAEKNIRERFGVEIPHIFFSGNGVDGILEQIITQLINDPYDKKVRILGVGAHFTHVVNYAKRYGYLGEPDAGNMVMPYSSITVPFGETLSEAINRTIIARANDRRGNTLVYANIPSSPTGENASLDDKRRLVEATADQGDVLVIDESLADFKSDDESAISLLADHENLAVLRGWSKAYGESKERIGYIALSEELGEAYRNILKIFHISASQKILINAITDPDISQPHLEKVRRMTRQIKGVATDLINQNFAPLGIRILPTDSDTPIFVLDSRGLGINLTEGLKEANVQTASGAGFSETDKQYSFELVRLTIPATEQECHELVKRIHLAIAA